jgi:hypothetical protein
MPSILVGTAGTGTLAVAAPLAPTILKRTCHDPEAMIQREPVKNAGSLLDAFIASAVGGCFEASPVSGRGVTVSEWIGTPLDRTSNWATPGITSGVRTVTNSLYCPTSTV